MKRTFLATLVLLLLIIVLPTNAEAATVIDSGQLGDFANWELTDDGTLIVSGRYQITPYYTDLLRSEHEADIKHIVINIDHPDVDASLTDRLPNLVSVDFSGSTVETIPYESFAFCPKLETVILPSSLKEIGNYAFYDCSSLNSIDFPEGLEVIGEGAFVRTPLTSLTMPSTLRTIGPEAFLECKSLTSVTLNDGLLNLGNKAFYDCINLTGNLYLPASLADGETGDIGFEAFGNCKSFTSLESHVSIPDDMFTDSTTLTSAKIIGNATYISNNAFSGCTNLKEVELGSALGTIGGSAFYNCVSLAEVILPDGLTTINNGAFAGSGIRNIILPASVTTLDMSVFSNCADLEYADLSQLTLDQLENYTFSECTSLTTVKLPNTPIIGGSAFAGCNSLEEIEWPEILEEIQQEAFEGCTGLTEIVLPEALTTLGQQAFLNCTNLRSITVPEGIETISVSAFAGCTGLAQFVIYSNDFEFTTDVEPAMFADCSNVTIYAPAGSTAETYANEMGIPFVSLSGESHVYDDGVVTTEATCTEPGVITYTCTECGFSYTRSIEPTGHELAEIPVYNEADRTHSFSCVHCEEKEVYNCDFYMEEVTSEATVASAGVITHTCSICGGTYETYFYLRLAGSNRYQTAFLSADQLKVELGVEQFENIVVASGTGFADALAGSYLAVRKNAPILLVNKNTTADVADYIEANLAEGGTVYLLGGEAAIPAAMEEELAGLNVERLAGANRYETNLLILAEAGFAGEEILVCTGNGFADSLSASAVGKPILLVNKSLNADQLEFVESTSGEFVIIGGESAVSAAVEETLSGYGTVERLAGDNRYETSVLVAEYFFDAPTSAVVAYSQNFPDGLCGGPLAAATNSPLLLMATNRGDNVIEYANEVGISCGAVLGGIGLIDDATAKNVFSMK